MSDSGRADEVLRVHRSRTLDGGFWSPAYGDLSGPKEWEFLPAGDANLTRTVKRLGPHWVVVKSGKGYTRTVGVLAPSPSVGEARKLAETTEVRRLNTRKQSLERRQRQEGRYKQCFAEAVLKYLSFAPRHADVAQRIAEGAAQRATVVGSGRVGRTQTLSLEEKAELAARAYIRHRHTKFEDRLIGHEAFLEPEDFAYREAKAEAHEEVDEFLRRHRRQQTTCS